MDVSCPHCELSIALLEEQLREEIVCPSCGSSFKAEPGTTSTWSPSEGQRTLGRFELIDHIGIGAFGTVYKARDPQLDRMVAIKVPRAAALASKEDLDRFLREARSVAQLRHPGIVPVFEVGKADDLPFLVSEYVDGVTLSDLSTGRNLTHNEAAELIEAVARALEYAHAQGVIHRDVKPANIIVGEDGQPRLMDFGLAKRDMGETTMTVAGQVIGTPAYMSPEQASGQAHHVDGRSDVYSLGVILYWLLTGKLPFRGNSRMLIFQVQHDEPPPPRKLDKSVPRDLETICLKAMAKAPNQRYFTAHGLADDLRRYLGGEPIHARRITPITRLWRWCRRKPAAAGLCVSLMALAVSVCVLTIFMLGHGDPGPLGIFLNDGLPPDRLEALEELPLNEPPTVLEVLEKLEGMMPRGPGSPRLSMQLAQDADFVKNALDILSNKSDAAGWNPENFEIYTRLALPPQTIKFIAGLSADEPPEGLFPELLGYLGRLRLGSLPRTEQSETIRELVLIISDHKNEELQNRCVILLDGLPVQDFCNSMIEVFTSSPNLRSPAKRAMQYYAENGSAKRVREIGRLTTSRLADQLNAEPGQPIRRSSDMEFLTYIVGLTGDGESLEVVASILKNRKRLRDAAVLKEAIESVYTLQKRTGKRTKSNLLRDVVGDPAVREQYRGLAVQKLVDLVDDESIDVFLAVAVNADDNEDVRGKVISGLAKLVPDESAKRKVIKALLGLLQTHRKEEDVVVRAALNAMGKVGDSKHAKELIDFLRYLDFNRAANVAIQTLILRVPSGADQVVHSLLSWSVANPVLPPELDFEPLQVLTNLALAVGFDDQEKKSAAKAVIEALGECQSDEDGAVGELAGEWLGEMGKVTKVSPTELQSDNEGGKERGIR